MAELDEITREAIETPAALAAWERALEAPAWDGRDPVWIHADLLRPNVLVRSGALSAVIDFGSVGVGDPAADLVAAWAMFEEDERAVYLSALDPDAGRRRACPRLRAPPGRDDHPVLRGHQPGLRRLDQKRPRAQLAALGS